jgi:DNA repair photolyase
MQNKEKLPALNSKIVKEAKHWLHSNRGVSIGAGCYDSPRVSSEIADCSMPLTFDQYNMCSLGCLYCFAYAFKLNNPANNGELHLKAINVKKLLRTMNGENPTDPFYTHFYAKRFLLHWGGLADPFCNFEKHNKVGLQFMHGLGEMGYPTLFSFKGSSIHEKHYIHLLERFAAQSNFAFQSSIVTNDDNLAKRVEIGVASTTERLKTLKMLSDMGYWTILRLRPFIQGVTDIGLDELLDRALEAGINAVSVEWFALDTRAPLQVKERYAWLSQLVGTKDLIKYYTKLSPSERGGYKRLNRLVKESHIKCIYQFCAKNGLVCGISDPDFKELNTSGSCCGMPDHFPKNRELENWTTSQLTYHLKEARRAYHILGEDVLLKFSDVYKSDEAYLDDAVLASGNVAIMGTPNAIRRSTTQRMILQRHWNNLNSPANPRNYFHGKLMPCKELDNDGNLIFKYTPSEYEKRWKAEGIDLTR